MEMDRIQNILEQNRNRQKAYYNKHKQEILDKKAVEREQIRILNTPPPPEPIIPTEFSLEDIIEVFTKTITNQNTLKKYILDIKRVFRLSGIDKFTGSLEEYIIIKESLENSKYAVSTVKGSFQAILVFIEHSKILIDKTIVSKYDKMHKIYIIKYDDANSAKKTEDEHNVLPYNVYLNKILEHYGTDSREYLIACLYNELTCRDDYGNMRIIGPVPYDDGESNYMFIDENKECSAILNNYKTKNRYGKVVRVFSAELSSLIVSYIGRNRLAGLLFPDNQNGMSRFITQMNKKVGVKGGANYLRHSKVSQFLKTPDITPEMRLNFSSGMMHSENVQKKYQRGVIDESLKIHCN
jgi:hypothetical protein